MKFYFAHQLPAAFCQKISYVINWLYIWGASKFQPVMQDSVAVKWFSVSSFSRGKKGYAFLWLCQFLSLCLKSSILRKAYCYLLSVYPKKALPSETLIHLNEYWNIFKIWFLNLSFLVVAAENWCILSNIFNLQVELLWFKGNVLDYQLNWAVFMYLWALVSFFVRCMLTLLPLFFLLGLYF